MSKIIGKKVNKYDPYQLCDAVDSHITDILIEKGFTQKQGVFLLKMLLAVACVFLGAYSYLKLVPIQKYFALNVAFLLAYWAVCLVFYYIDFFIEKNYFFDVSESGDDKMKGVKDIKFSSDTGLFDGKYVLGIEGVKGLKNVKVSETKCVG